MIRFLGNVDGKQGQQEIKIVRKANLKYAQLQKNVTAYIIKVDNRKLIAENPNWFFVMIFYIFGSLIRLLRTYDHTHMLSDIMLQEIQLVEIQYVSLMSFI